MHISYEYIVEVNSVNLSFILCQHFECQCFRFLFQIREINKLGMSYMYVEKVERITAQNDFNINSLNIQDLPCP